MAEDVSSDGTVQTFNLHYPGDEKMCKNTQMKKRNRGTSEVGVIECVCVSWSPVKGVQGVKHAIPIANSCPRCHPFHTLGLSSTTPWDSCGWQPWERAQGGSNELLYLGYWTLWPQFGGCSTT